MQFVFFISQLLYTFTLGFAKWWCRRWNRWSCWSRNWELNYRVRYSSFGLRTITNRPRFAPANIGSFRRLKKKTNGLSHTTALTNAKEFVSNTGSRARRWAAASNTRSTAGRFAPSRVGRSFLGTTGPTRARGFHDSSPESNLDLPTLPDLFFVLSLPSLSSSDASSDG